MGLADITDRQAVLDAVAEYDRRGADAFLEKYGFGRARSYFLEVSGRSYDSKAIIGAAHGYQFPRRGALKAGEFSGGESTVRAKLEELGFTVVKAGGAEETEESDAWQRNPPWNRDELIIALDAYVRWKGNPPAKTSTGIAELSTLLNNLRRAIGTHGSPTLRNTNGAYMKLMNFRRFDPVYASQGKSGLKSGNKLEEEVWNEFHDNPARLALVVVAIKAGISAAILSPLGYDDTPIEGAEDVDAIEGAVVTKLHRQRERSRKLVERKKDVAIKATGRLACEVCGFEYLARYGERGRGFIECHHTKPIETLGDGTPTKLADLTLLCANCHRMIHARRPWLTVMELRGFIRP